MTVSDRSLTLMKLAFAGCLVAAVAASASERPKHQPGLTPEAAASAATTSSSSSIAGGFKRDKPAQREFTDALTATADLPQPGGSDKAAGRGKGQRGSRLKMDSEASSSN